MTEPRNSTYQNTQVQLDSSRSFQDFQRILVDRSRTFQEQGFDTLSTTERQELMEKLIDRVKDL